MFRAAFQPRLLGWLAPALLLVAGFVLLIASHIRPGAHHAATLDSPAVPPPIWSAIAVSTPPVPTGPPIVPSIDAPMKARLRAIYLAGLSRGNRPEVFAKVGDSI